MKLPTVLLTGCHGQLGTAFNRYWENSPLRNGFELVGLGRERFDISDHEELSCFLADLHPNTILNTAAYTQVDAAESDIETAYAVNEKAVKTLVSWCANNGCRLIHISTDFVFDGLACKPYTTDAATNPLSVYGSSKLAGENHVIRGLPAHGVVVRTSWLYSEYGTNFVKAMLKLMHSGRALRVVADQVGSPTSAHSLSVFLGTLVAEDSRPGIYHFSDGGQVSWYDFALAIQEAALEIGLLSKRSVITPVPATEYPTAATRPAYSVLEVDSRDAGGHDRSQNWMRELREVLKRVQESTSSTLD